MDSASKAIIFAGGILIGVLIISISMYMLTAFRDVYESSMNEFEAQQIASFNSYFTQFGSTIKGYDAYNIIGKINEVNTNPNSNYFIHFSSNDIIKQYDSVNQCDIIKREKTFYYTETFLDEFTYSYEFDLDGAIYRVRIDNPRAVVAEP